jgi:hypothetical protein
MTAVPDERATTPTVIVREGGRSSIPEKSVIEPKGRGVLDAPHARGMTIPREAGTVQTGKGTPNAIPFPFPAFPIFRKTLYGAARFTIGEW